MFYTVSIQADSAEPWSGFSVGDRKLTRNQAFDSEDPDDLVLGSEQ